MAKKIQDGNQIVTNVDSNDNLTFSIKSSFIDSTPTVNSTNLVTSGGVKSALDINTTDIAAAVIRIANNETNISNNTTKIGTLSNLTTTSKTNLVSAINELNAPEKWVSVGTTAPTDGRRVWFKKSVNLFDASTFVTGDIITGNPTIRLSSRQALWLESGTYTFSTNQVSPFRFSLQVENVGIPPLSAYPTYIYNSNWQKTSSYTFTLTTPGYIVINISKDNNATLTLSEIANYNYQLQLGSSATSYELYIDQGIYVDNEHFTFDNYSTSEQVIGKWIDGKPLYRKVITFGALANNGNKTIPYGSSNNLIKFDIYAKNPTGNYLFKVPLGGTNYINSYVEMNSHQIVVQTNSDRTNVTDNYVIIEYTKTTD